MKSAFEEPSFEVVRFNYNVITQSWCYCFAGDTDFGPGQDDACVGRNDPRCTCGLDNPVNCVD